MNSEFSIAVHSLVLLTHRPDHMAKSEMIARSVCTHPARVRKVMSILRNHGFVTTKEGSGGGYLLNCDPKTTNLAQIYRAVAIGSLKPNWCSGKSEMDCVVSANIHQVMDQLFLEAEQHLQLYWQRWTLEDILQRIHETGWSTIGQLRRNRS